MADYHFKAAPGATDTSPLLLLFHGTGGDENQFFDLGPQLLPGARIVAPRGDVSEHGALRYFRRTGEGTAIEIVLDRRGPDSVTFSAPQLQFVSPTPDA